MEDIKAKFKDLVKDMSIGYSILFGVFIILLFLLLAFAVILWHAWAVVVLWGWFAVPTFNLPMLGYWQAAGVCMLIALMRPVPYPKEVSGSVFGRAVLGPPIAVLFGYAVKHLAGM